MVHIVYGAVHIEGHIEVHIVVRYTLKFVTTMQYSTDTVQYSTHTAVRIELHRRDAE